MPKITSFFSADTRNDFQRRMLEACEKLADEFGVKIEPQRVGASQDGANFEPRFRVSVLREDGTVFNPEAHIFRTSCAYFGLKPEDLGREFTTSKGVRYRIEGIKPSRPKYPISAVRVRDGSPFKFPASLVRDALEFSR